MGVDTSHQRIASPLRRASPIRFESGCKTRESNVQNREFRIFFRFSKTFRKRWPYGDFFFFAGKPGNKNEIKITKEHGNQDVTVGQNTLP